MCKPIPPLPPLPPHLLALTRIPRLRALAVQRVGGGSGHGASAYPLHLCYCWGSRPHLSLLLKYNRYKDNDHNRRLGRVGQVKLLQRGFYKPGN
jgi:hypothetical protein